MRFIDRLAQRYGQHPDAIVSGDTYAFRLIDTLAAWGLLTDRPPTESAPAFPSYDDDPTGLATMTETL